MQGCTTTVNLEPGSFPQYDLAHSCANFITDISQAFAAADRIRNMRPREAFDSERVPFDICGLEHGKRPGVVKIELRNIWFTYQPHFEGFEYDRKFSETLDTEY